MLLDHNYSFGLYLKPEDLGKTFVIAWTTFFCPPWIDNVADLVQMKPLLSGHDIVIPTKCHENQWSSSGEVRNVNCWWMGRLTNKLRTVGDNNGALNK